LIFARFEIYSYLHILHFSVEPTAGPIDPFPPNIKAQIAKDALRLLEL
jgi:hypothetical protein